MVSKISSSKNASKPKTPPSTAHRRPSRSPAPESSQTQADIAPSTVGDVVTKTWPISMASQHAGHTASALPEGQVNQQFGEHSAANVQRAFNQHSASSKHSASTQQHAFSERSAASIQQAFSNASQQIRPSRRVQINSAQSKQLCATRCP